MIHIRSHLTRGSILWSNSHPLLFSFCLLFLSGVLVRHQKKLGFSPNFQQEKRPLPQEFPRNGRSDGGRLEVEQYKPCPYNSNRQSCHTLKAVLLPALAWSKLRSTDPVSKDCRKYPHSQLTMTRHPRRHLPQQLLQVNNFDSRIRAAPVLRHTFIPLDK